MLQDLFRGHAVDLLEEGLGSRDQITKFLRMFAELAGDF
jgi:hypothetical protein